MNTFQPNATIPINKKKPENNTQCSAYRQQPAAAPTINETTVLVRNNNDGDFAVELSVRELT